MTHIDERLSTFGIARLAAAFLILFGATALTVRCVAVASQSPPGTSSDQSAANAGPPLTVEQLAAKAGCKPKIQINAAELRQGYCATSTGRYFVTTFTTAKGQQDWLGQARDYGAHLVGNRWVVSAGPQVLEKLRGALGGEVQSAAQSHGHG